MHARMHERMKVIVQECNRVRSVTEHKKGRETRRVSLSMRAPENKPKSAALTARECNQA